MIFCISLQFTLLCTDMIWVTLAPNPPHSLDNYTDFLLCIMKKNCKHLLHLPESSQGFCLYNGLVKCHWPVTMGQSDSVPCLKDLGIYENHSSPKDHHRQIGKPSTGVMIHNKCNRIAHKSFLKYSDESHITNWTFPIVFPPSLWKMSSSKSKFSVNS